LGGFFLSRFSIKKLYALISLMSATYPIHFNFIDLNTVIILSCVLCNYGVWIGELDLLTQLYTPHETTSNYIAIANLHTLQITTEPAKPFLACCVFNSRFIATASNSGNSSAFRAHVVTVRRISRNWTQPAWGPRYTASGRTQQKSPPPTVLLLLLWAAA
jgi:hypothetical protein